MGPILSELYQLDTSVISNLVDIWDLSRSWWQTYEHMHIKCAYI